jgi:ATP-dependent RNA helicase RhlE
MSFDSLGLAPAYLRAVAEEGYTEPTPVQRQAIPIVLEGRDLLAGAQTGTGKTAAFVLPMLQRLHAPAGTVAPAANVGWGSRRGAAAPAPSARSGRQPVRALVLAPTRELALQVEESFRTYGRHQPMRSVAIYGGVGFGPQVSALRAGAPIVVATPGRLLDHISQRTLDLSHVEILVLDEADRMLDMGFIRDIRRVLELLPKQRQTLLFSATFSPEIRELAEGLLISPATVDVAPRNATADLVEQLVIPVDRERKRELLTHLVRSGRISQALVFTRTKHGANRLAEQLGRDGVPAAAIHGNKSQGQRIRALDDFKQGRVGILVATDIAARGIDVEALPHVVNYELPMVAADYVHRIGRTGRAGTDGTAVSLVSVDEAELLRDIQRLLKRQLPSEVVDGFAPDRTIPAEPIALRSGDRGRSSAPRRSGGGRAPARTGRIARPGEAPGLRGPSAHIGQPPAGLARAAGSGRPAGPSHGASAPRSAGPARPGSARPGQPRPGQAPKPFAAGQSRHAGLHRGPAPAQGHPAGHRPSGPASVERTAVSPGHRPMALPGERLRRAAGPEHGQRQGGHE